MWPNPQFPAELVKRKLQYFLTFWFFSDRPVELLKKVKLSLDDIFFMAWSCRKLPWKDVIEIIYSWWLGSKYASRYYTATITDDFLSQRLTTKKCDLQHSFLAKKKSFLVALVTFKMVLKQLILFCLWVEFYNS